MEPNPIIRVLGKRFTSRKTKNKITEQQDTRKPQSPSPSYRKNSITLLNRGNVEELMVTAVTNVLEEDNYHKA